MRQLVVLVLGTLLLMAFASAANYQIDSTPIVNSILPNETATYQILINNFDRTGHRFQIYTTNTKWIVRVDPAINIVQPTRQETYTILLKPTTNVGFGTEGVTVIVKELDEQILHHLTLLVNVANPRLSGGYQPSVQFDVSVPSSINPRLPLPLTMNLRNRNQLNITEMQLVLESPLLSRTKTLALDPLGERSADETFSLDTYQAPGDYPLNAKLIYQGTVINEVAKTLHVETISDISETTLDNQEFLRHETILTIENKGNAKTIYESKLATTWLRSVFSSTTPEAEKTNIGGIQYHIWSVTLAPRQTTTVSRVENYRLFTIIIIVIIFGIISYFLFRSPVIAAKEAIQLKEHGEEGSGTLKVRIFVKNRTGKQLSGVSVIDRMPSIATYKAQTSLGAVSPTKVVHAEKGTVLKWELDILEPYEERILSYGLGSQLKILGKMKLPAAKVKFATKRGERITYTKNTVYEE